MESKFCLNDIKQCFSRVFPLYFRSKTRYLSTCNFPKEIQRKCTGQTLNMTVSNEKTRFGNSSYFSLKQIVFKTNPEIYVHFRQDPSDLSCATCQRAAMKPLTSAEETTSWSVESVNA